MIAYKKEFLDGSARHWFPLALVGLFLILVGIGVHGSSVGCWSMFLGPDTEYPHIGDSPAVRSDDWVVSQPFIIGQCASGEYFPRVNRKVNEGTDMFLQTPCGLIFDGWRKFKDYAERFYPECEVISINPVGIKGLFKDVYTKSYLAMHPELTDVEVIN